MVWPRSSSSGDKAASVAAGAIKSIAVLPLVNLSGDKSQEYFADALTDELIGALGRVTGVNVISRTSVQQFKGSQTPLPEIARMLHADGILEGSVAVTGGGANEQGAARRVRVNARLIYAGNDTQLWDRTFERVLSDVLTIQSDIARAVAAEIGTKLSARQTGTAPETRSPEAQDRYLQAQYLMNVRTRQNLIAARHLLEEAVTLDSQFARAYAALAKCYSLLQLYGVMSVRDALPLAAKAVDTSVRLDANLPEARRLAGDERVRVWRLYLRAARNGFETGFTSVYQSLCRLPGA
jgi:TolB-like protein